MARRDDHPFNLHGSGPPAVPAISPGPADLTRADTIVAADHQYDGDDATLASPSRTYTNNRDDRRRSAEKPQNNHQSTSGYSQAHNEANDNHKPRLSMMHAHFVAVSAEFLGTFFFLWCALAGTSYAVNESSNTINTSPVIVNYYASVVFGLSLLANVWIFFRISEGVFNPAVTLGLVIAGKLPLVRGLLYFPTQMLAGMAASGLVQAMFPGPLSGVTRLGNNTSTAQGLWIEAFLTAMLTKAVLILAGEKHKATYLAPVGIGLAFFSAELVGIPYTGGSLNPARSFGPDLATLSFESYHWIYWVGPCLGALAASGYDGLARLLKYREANPGQDAAHVNEDA